MFKYQFRWDVIPNNLDFLLSGLNTTLILSAITLPARRGNGESEAWLR